MEPFEQTVQNCVFYAEKDLPAHKTTRKFEYILCVANSTQTQKSASRSTVALKVTMAITGLLFIAFLLVHMYGNLKMFLGPEEYNHYAMWLKGEIPAEQGGGLLNPILPGSTAVWGLRIVLLVSVILHMYSAFTLWSRAKTARGSVRYKVGHGVKLRPQKTYAAQTMRWGGVIIVIWLVFHLLQFTVLAVQPGGTYTHEEPYNNMVYAFSLWWIWLFYLVAMLAIALHVRHGVYSALATLGLSTQARYNAFRAIALIVALLLVIGFMAPPTAILFGAITL